MKMLIAAIVVMIVALVGFFAFAPKNNSVGKQQTTATDSQEQNQDSSESQVIAGTVTQFRTFTRAEYDKANADGKIVFLDFYANWCPICRAEAPEIEAGFNELNRPDVIGFRVNYKDDETSDDEKNLAKEFSIPYQHTKVILQNGKEVKRSGDEWDKETLLRELGSI